MRSQKSRVSGLTLVAAVSLLIAGIGTSTLAQDQTRDQDRLRDPIYGSQLMSPQERVEYQAKMRTLKTKQERESYRLEHHNQMQERARVQGVTLPETPPTARPRARLGPGYGGGAGTGNGSGPGAGNKK